MGVELEELRATVAHQAEEINNLREDTQGYESERDYYFGKLRSVEVYLQLLKANMHAKVDDIPNVAGLVGAVEKILYEEAQDDDGPEAPTQAERDAPIVDAGTTCSGELVASA